MKSILIKFRRIWVTRHCDSIFVLKNLCPVRSGPTLIGLGSWTLLVKASSNFPNCPRRSLRFYPMKTQRDNPGGASERSIKRRHQARGSQSRTSDSSEIDGSLFISPERKSSFESSYRYRNIVNGRRVVLSHFEGFDIVTKIDAMGWTPMITMDVPIFPRLVRLFYCNMEFNRDEPSITSLVNGTAIHLNCCSLGTILGIPNEGTEYYKTCRWETDDCHIVEAIRIVCENDKILRSSRPSHRFLPAHNRLLHNMLTFMFLPRGRQRDMVSKMDLFLLKKIICGERVNLCYIIIRYMIDSIVFKRRNSHLPYGMLLTKVFNACNVDISPEEEFETLKPGEVYNLASLSRRGFVRTDAGWRLKKGTTSPDEEEEGLEDEDEDEDDEQEDQSGDEEEEEKPALMDGTPGDLSSDGPKSSSFACETGSIHESLSKLTARVDSLESSVQSLQCQQEQGFANLNLKLDSLMDFLNHHFWPYPPPPAPFDG